MEHHYTEVQKDKGKHETRRCHTEVADHRRRVIAKRILSDRRINANGNRHTIRENDGGDRQHDGESYPLAKHVCNRSMQPEGNTEVAMKNNVSYPSRVTLIPGAIQTKLVAHSGHILL